MKNLIMCLMIIGCLCTAINAMESAPKYIANVWLGNKLVQVTSGVPFERLAAAERVPVEALLRRLAQMETGTADKWGDEG